MGVQVNKVLGYGLTNVKTKNGKIIDERIKKTGYMFKNNRKWSIKNFQYFWEKNKFKSLSEYSIFEPDNDIKIDMCINYCSEDPKTLIITPISSVKNWSRRDDIIDYQDETYTYNQNDRHQIYDFGIYPWIYSFCDSNGERWVNKEKPYYTIVREFIETKNNKQLTKYEIKDKLKYLTKLLNFTSIEEAEENILPLIPEEVQMLCRYLNLFNDKKTIYELRPMLYVFWD
jgi:hypothetical protein